MPFCERLTKWWTSNETWYSRWHVPFTKTFDYFPWSLDINFGDFFFVDARQINRSACDHNRERMQNQSTSDFLTVKWILFFDWIAKLITTLTVCNRKGPYALLLRHDFLLWLFSELIFFSNCFSTRLLIMHVRSQMVLVITHQIKTLTTLHLLAWQKKRNRKRSSLDMGSQLDERWDKSALWGLTYNNLSILQLKLNRNATSVWLIRGTFLNNS